MKDILRHLRRNSARPAARPAPRHPQLETLEARTVPSTLDLTAAGSQGNVGGVLFQQNNTQPTGSGVIHSFVRLFSSGGATMEQGYNTDARPFQYNENNSPVFTRSLQLGEVPMVTVNGVAYRKFLLDINQKHSSPLLSLDELRIYVGNAGNLYGYDQSTQQLAGMSAVYDMGVDSSGVNNTVLLNAALSHGSGSGDVFVLVPDALLTAPGGNYLYLYSKFGASVPTNGGFEEWAVQAQTNALGSLSGYVYLDNNQNGIFDTGDTGIQDVMVTITGTDNLGHQVQWSQWTDANGFYIFSGLYAGTYTITESQPGQYSAGAVNVGSLGGTPGADQIASILLAPDAIGRNYDFGNLQMIGPGTA
jgi:hypothetical protein